MLATLVAFSGPLNAENIYIVSLSAVYNAVFFCCSESCKKPNLRYCSLSASETTNI